MNVFTSSVYSKYMQEKGPSLWLQVAVGLGVSLVPMLLCTVSVGNHKYSSL